MKIERTKNATRNIIFGVILKGYQILIPFVLRTAIIYKLGVEYAGLNNLFASILQVLNLAELGVGSAMTFSMYKPIADDDKEMICRLMRLYRIYYRIIGWVVLVLGLVLMPVLPMLIKVDTVPEGIDLNVLYLLNLAAVVVSYWLFAYKNALLTAHQRNDVSSKIMLITNTCQYALQIAAIVWLRSYYWYLIVLLVTQIATNVVTAVVAQRIYPDYHPKGKLAKEIVQDINRKVRDLFTAKIGTVIANSSSSIVISAILGLRALAIYQNYYFVINSIIGIVMVVFISCMAGIGNSLIVESREKNYADLRKFTFIVSWIAGLCTSCFLCLFQPFMELWMGKDMMLDYGVVVSLCVYYYIFEINQMLNIYKDAAGIWRKDRYRPLVKSICILGLSTLLVNLWGICGVVVAWLLVAVCIGIPWLLHNLFTTVFEKAQLGKYVGKLLKYTVIAFIACAVCVLLCQWATFESLILTMVARGVVCVVVYNLVCVIVFRREEEFLQAKQLVRRMLKRGKTV